MTPHEITNAIRAHMSGRRAYVSADIADALGLPIAQIGPALSYLRQRGEIRRCLWENSLWWVKVNPID